MAEPGRPRSTGRRWFATTRWPIINTASNAAYGLDHCRPCCAAQHDYETNRVRRHAYGTWATYIDAQPVREHAQNLLAAGLGRRQILALFEVSSGSFTKLIYGAGERPPAARIRPETAAKLQALPVPSIAGLAPGAKVPAIGARRRVQALARLLTRDLTLAQTHIAIALMYD